MALKDFNFKCGDCDVIDYCADCETDNTDYALCQLPYICELTKEEFVKLFEKHEHGKTREETVYAVQKELMENK